MGKDVKKTIQNDTKVARDVHGRLVTTMPIKDKNGKVIGERRVTVEGANAFTGETYYKKDGKTPDYIAVYLGTGKNKKFAYANFYADNGTSQHVDSYEEFKKLRKNRKASANSTVYPARVQYGSDRDR